MLKNYLKTAWRNLLRGKGFSVINISGLAIGMTGAILILLWLQNEISFDKFHKNKNRLYQVYGLSSNVDGKAFAISETSQPLGPALKENYPEITAASRVKDINSFLLTTNNKSFTGINGIVTDNAFLQMFSFPLAEGSAGENSNAIIITQELARKIFGEEDAVGRIIRIDSTDNFTVTGVLKDLPGNTRFNFEFLLPWSYLKKIGYNNDSWLSNNTTTYVLLQPHTNLAAFNKKIAGFSRVKTGRDDIWTHFLFPLRQWHLYSSFENGIPAGGRIETVRVFGSIAAFILLIACINFVNLSTARSEKRAREVGIRKVAGAGKGLLIGQFIAEAFLMVLVAGGIALIAVQLALPAFNTLTGAVLFVPYQSLLFWLCALAFVLLTSLLAGSYPAFYLASFRPVSIFKKQFLGNRAIFQPRKALVVLQFTIAIILIVATIVVHRQVQYAQNRDKGYSDNNLLHVNFTGEMEKNYPLIKQDLLNAGIASSVTKTLAGIGEGGAHTWGFRWQGENPADTNTTITIYSADAGLVKTAGLKLVAGRDIDINKYPADSFSVMLNETAVKLTGFKDPIGQLISQPHSNINWRVVGVVKDYIQGSPYEEVPPTVIAGPGAWFNTMQIKFSPGQTTSACLAQTEKIFKKYNLAYPFNYQFADEQYAAKFESAKRTKTMAALFASLAIFISCLGLFGLSACIAESKVKEIGVRKVLGASALSITKLLSLDFVKLVMVAIVIATPVAWLAMNKWLAGYAYRVTVGWSIFLAAGALAIAIALLTVSFQSVKAAMANPVKSLKME